MKILTKFNKVIVILGPTASGKSDIAIKLARRFNGEIISADSRQIYRGMDIGSGKVTKLEQKMANHWMLDIISPTTDFNAFKFQKAALKKVNDIISRSKLPIICGGTGFWIKSIVDNIDFPEVKPDWKLRNKLENKSPASLYKVLKKLDPARANDIDQHNQVRLIRAIEICKILGKVPLHSEKKKNENKRYDFLQIGIRFPKKILDKKIKLRLNKRFKQGMIAEVKNLHFQKNVSWKRLENFGLEYRWIARFLQKKIALPEMKERLYQDIKNYAKRQMTWFRKNELIIWISDKKEIEGLVRKFLALSGIKKD